MLRGPPGRQLLPRDSRALDGGFPSLYRPTPFSGWLLSRRPHPCCVADAAPPGGQVANLERPLSWQEAPAPAGDALWEVLVSPETVPPQVRAERTQSPGWCPRGRQSRATQLGCQGRPPTCRGGVLLLARPRKPSRARASAPVTTAPQASSPRPGNPGPVVSRGRSDKGLRAGTVPGSRWAQCIQGPRGREAGRGGREDRAAGRRPGAGEPPEGAGPASSRTFSRRSPFRTSAPQDCVVSSAPSVLSC